MAIGIIGTTTTNTTGGTATSITVSHTVPSTDGNRMLIVGYTADSADSTSATFGAASMTEGSVAAGHGANHVRYYAHFFWLANPATGADTVTVNFASNTTQRAVFAMTLKDAKQTAPVNGQGVGGTTAVTSRQTTITTTSGNSLFFTLQKTGIDANTFVQDAGQTERVNVSDANSREMILGTESASTTSYVGGTSWTTSDDVEQHVWGIFEDVAVVAGHNMLPLLGVG